jgi:hypothetical protein
MLKCWQGLIDICIESAGELLRSNFGKEIIYEVVNMLTLYQWNSDCCLDGHNLVS